MEQKNSHLDQLNNVVDDPVKSKKEKINNLLYKLILEIKKRHIYISKEVKFIIDEIKGVLDEY